MQSVQLETPATAVVARFEQVGAAPDESTQVLLRWSHAGHPPALLVDPGGVVTRLADADANDLLLGFDPAAARHEGVVALEAGATLVLYTDGLVERRDRDIDDGIEALERLLAEVAPVTLDLDHLCDRLLGAMSSEELEDDVALLVVRWTPDPA
jgi:serine phosphatase RsbU (regulator of sigma subunit)